MSKNTKVKPQEKAAPSQGPWFSACSGGDKIQIVQWDEKLDCPRGLVAEVNKLISIDCNGNSPEAAANARLMSAAPELKEALELHIAFLDSLNKGWLAKCCGDIGLLNEAYLKGNEALAKVRGLQ